MKRFVPKISIIVLISILVVVACWVLPKYTTRLIGFGLILVIDFLYYPVYRAFFKSKNDKINRVIQILFWLPLFLFVVYVIALLIWPMQVWIPFFKIYFIGLLIPLFLWKFVLLIFFFLNELVSLPINLYNLVKKLFRGVAFQWFRLRALLWVGSIVAICLPVILLSGYVFWVYDFEVKKVETHFTELPSGFDGFKIVQISDLHLGSWLSKKPLEKAVSEINSLHPDMVVFTGDLVNYSTNEAFVFRQTLLKIKAPSGIYAILGNHDYGDYVQWVSANDKKYNNRELRGFYKSLGWKLLENEHVVLKAKNDSILLIGVENWSANKMWGRRGDMKKATLGIQEVPFQILLSHDPTHWRKEVLPLYPQVDLTLSGHTHAMQFGWEGKYFRWSPSEWLFPEWAGLYEQRNEKSGTQYLYVNRGLGHLGFPGRVGIRPEITLITLRK